MTLFDIWSRWVAKTARPILVGPWRDETGTEILYWVPFVAQWAQRYGIARERLVVISRGGSAYWYPGVQRVELSDYWPAETARLEALRGQVQDQSVKQLRVSALERALYPMVAARRGLRRYHVLHPQHLFTAIKPWTTDQMSLADVVSHLRFEQVPTPMLPLTVALPEHFVCVRFYARATWPLTEEITEWCTQVVGQIAKTKPVVVIGSSAHLDDHLDLNFTGPNITSLVDAFPLRDNLALQSAVIARSDAFVGTYGGTMQLAARLGTPSAGFYLTFHGTAFGHKTLTEWLAVQQHVPIFIGTPTQAEMIRSIVNVSLELPQPAGSSSGVMA